MRIYSVIIGLSWVAFWLYWIISAVSAKQNAQPQFKRFFVPRLGLIALVVLLSLFFHKLPHSLKVHAVYDNKAILVAGFIVYLLGLVLAIWARVYLGKNWGMPMTVKQDPELVTSGPYRYIRHPIYSGFLLMALGSSLDVNTYWYLVLAVSAVYFIYSAVNEEKLLAKQFPKVYASYKTKTKMLIPFIL
jgi:protein-S-isoprenylcysteine O-methyltransferase Ste14